MASRFYPPKDMDLIDRFNRELVGDARIGKDGFIGQEVIIYRVSVQDTKANMYGESADGKTFRPGVKLSCVIDAEDFDFETNEFGPDNRQNVTFAFQGDYLIDVNFRPNIGDIVSWNDGYFEINSFNENQLVGGQTDNNHSIVATAHLVRLSSLNIEEFRSI